MLNILKGCFIISRVSHHNVLGPYGLSTDVNNVKMDLYVDQCY